MTQAPFQQPVQPMRQPVQPAQPAQPAALPSAADLLSASTYAKFATPGDVATGTVCKPPRTQQQTDFATKEPAFWRDGSPKLEVIITLQGEDPDAPPVDVYARGGLLGAIKQALVPASGKCEVGGKLWVQYTGDGEAKPGMHPPKLFKAAYDPPMPPGIAAPTPIVGVTQPVDPTTMLPDPALTPTQAANDVVAEQVSQSTIGSGPPF